MFGRIDHVTGTTHEYCSMKGAIKLTTVLGLGKRFYSPRGWAGGGQHEAVAYKRPLCKCYLRETLKCSTGNNRSRPLYVYALTSVNCGIFLTPAYYIACTLTVSMRAFQLYAVTAAAAE